MLLKKIFWSTSIQVYVVFTSFQISFNAILIFSDDAEKMFEEAKVISPNRKEKNIIATASNTPSTAKNWIGRKISTSGSSSGNPAPEVYDCEICFLSLPRPVSISG